MAGAGLAYYLAAELSLRLALLNASITPLWPPAGIALAATLLGGNRILAGVFAGAFLANVTNIGSEVAALGIACGNTLESYVGARLMRRLASQDNRLDTFKALLVFLVPVAFGTTMIAASVGTATLALTGHMSPATFGVNWLTWWLGDALGIVLVAPLILAWWTPSLRAYPRVQAAELVLATLLIVAACVIVFLNWPPVIDPSRPRAFVLFPLLAWVAIRFSLREATVLLVVVAGVALAGTIRGLGPLSGQDATANLLVMVAYLCVLSLTTLMLTVLTESRRRAESGLVAAKERTDRMLRLIPDVITVQDRKGIYLNIYETHTNPAAAPRLDLVGKDMSAAYPPEIVKERLACIDKALATGAAQLMEYTLVEGGRTYWLETRVVPYECDTVMSLVRDITERKHAEALLAGQNRILKLVAANGELRDVLLGLTRYVEELSGRGSCCILLLDEQGTHLSWGVAPGLPEPFQQGVLGMEVAAQSDSSGTAAYRKAPVIVADIASDPLWDAHRELALRHGLRACSSWPILGRKGQVLGTLALYYREPLSPSPQETQVVEASVELARIAIESAEAEQRIRYLALHDELTGLPNRAAFQDILQHALHVAVRHPRALAILFVDLDRFKMVNDTLGHDAGDGLLRQTAQRLRRELRQADTLARMGGDEFYILLENVADRRYVGEVAQRVVQAIAEPFLIDGHKCHVTASVGISTYPDDGTDTQTLLKNADISMYRAKALGKNTYQFYSADMQEHAAKRFDLESALRHAVINRELVLHYQPKVSLATGQVTGMEALLRWNRPDKGLVFPASFIALAEETGLIVEMGRWVLDTACSQTKAWQGSGFAELRVAVNLSARHFRQKELVDDVARALANSGLEARFLELEITESMVMDNPDEAAHIMQALKGMGVYLAMDDFGTGYSSLAYLKRFPVDNVKVDRSFIRDVPGDEDDVAIIRAIIAMAHSLGLKVIGEGVETAEQLEFLQEHGCDEFQGFHFCPPIPSEDFSSLLAGRRTPATTPVLHSLPR